jgi:aminoglycoside 6'-N-acetyltransferase I
MSIKTAIHDHLASSPLKDHFQNSSFKEHMRDNALKNHWSTHWDYFFQDKLESNDLKQVHDDNELIFRSFSWEDLDGCAQLFKKVFSADPWFDDWISTDQARKYLEELIRNPVSEGFIVLENSNIAAVCLGHRRSWWVGKEFFVDEFFVENERQGNGVGTKLMHFVTESLLKEGYTRLVLLTNRGIPAESFYLKKGFYNNYERTVMVKEL